MFKLLFTFFLVLFSFEYLDAATTCSNYNYSVYGGSSTYPVIGSVYATVCPKAAFGIDTKIKYTDYYSTEAAAEAEWKALDTEVIESNSEDTSIFTPGLDCGDYVACSQWYRYSEDTIKVNRVKVTGNYYKFAESLGCLGKTYNYVGCVWDDEKGECINNGTCWRCPGEPRPYWDESYLRYMCEYDVGTEYVDVDKLKYFIGNYSIRDFKYEYYVKYTGARRVCNYTINTSVPNTGFTFSLSNDSNAYCINPGYTHSTGGHTIDTSFDVSKCKNSLTNKDCGFSNILIEGTRKGYSYGVIATAMRLWSAFNDKRGYSIGTLGYANFGIPLTTGDYLISSDSSYIATVNAILNGNYFKGSIYQVDSVTDLFGVSCDTLGVMCGTKNTEYLKSIYLFINTYQGNNMMLNHLNELSGTKSETFQSQNIITNVTVDTEVNISKSKAELIFEVDNQRKVECNVEEGVNVEDCKAYIQVNIYLDDGLAEQVVIEADDYNEQYFDSCSKGYCTKTVYFEQLLCENIKGKSINYEVKVSTKKNTTSIVKLVTGDGMQDMYAFSSSSICDSTDVHTDKYNYNVFEREISDYPCSTCSQYECNIKDDAVVVKTADSDEKITVTSRSDFANIKNICKGKGVFNSSGEYDTYALSSVGDPSMNCIVNICYEKKKEKYDYSELFNVNTEVCRIYCRDEVRFYLANKTKVLAGMQFLYDLTPKLLNVNSFIGRTTKEHKLTSVVIKERECTSEIYFDENKNINNKSWLDLFKEESSYGNKTTSMQLIYDLMNCNMYEDSTINDLLNSYGIEYDKAFVNSSTFSNFKESVKDLYNINDETNSSLEINYATEKEYQKENIVYGTPNMESKDDFYLTEVKYCKNTPTRKCYKYDSITAANNNGDVSFDFNSNNPSKISELGSNLLFESLKIPVNDYATFSIIEETDFYNVSKYETEKFTGNVRKVEDSNTDSENYIKLNDYIYPVSLNLPSGVYDINHKYNISLFPRSEKQDLFIYALKGDLLSNIGPMSEYTCSYDVHNITIKYPNCYNYDDDGNIIEIDDGQCYGFEYRNVDLKNMFPSNRGGTNWTSDYAQTIVSEIKKEADDIFIDEDLLEYSFKLSTSAITAIRNYNIGKDYISDQNGHEFDNSLYNCDTESGMFLDCQSEFLHTANLESLGVVVIKDESKTKGSIKEVEE